MRKLTKQLAVLAILAAAGLTFGAASAGTMKSSGMMEATYAQREALPVADTQGHALLLTEATGVNANTDGSAYLDGFTFSVREIADMTQGNGDTQGYVIFSKGADQQIVRINGHVTTVMKDGQPNTTIKGKWKAIKGAGRYEGIEGDGTYSGYFTAEDKFHVDWKGWNSMAEVVAESK